MNTEPPPLDLDELGPFLEEMPMGLLIVDRQERILWTNRNLAGYLGLSPVDVQGRSLAQLPLEAAEHQTGEGRLLRVISGPAAAAEWLSRRDLTTPIGGERGHRVICFLDATDLENARLRVDRLTQALRGQVSTDRATGLLNRRGVRHQLDAQISRSRRYHNLLSVVLLRLPEPRERPALQETGMLALAHLLRDQTRWPDIVGRWSDQEFLLVLPETSAESAALLVEKIRAGIAETPADVGLNSIAYGIAEWRRGDDVQDLIARAQENLHAPESILQSASSTS